MTFVGILNIITLFLIYYTVLTIIRVITFDNDAKEWVKAMPIVVTIGFVVLVVRLFIS